MLKLSGKVFFTSDQHFNHANIIKYSSRPFLNVQEMDRVLVDNINNLVGKDDTLLFLGDWVFPGMQNYFDLARHYRDQIHCKNIICLIGNHDRAPAKEPILDVFMKIVANCSLDALMQQAQAIRNMDFLRLFNGVYDTLEVEYNHKKIFCSHYAHKVWNKSHHGLIHLYGHSHNSLPDDPNSLSMDVGVDSAAVLLGKDTLKPENYRPFTWQEVLSHMARKSFQPIDHHSKKTM